MPTHIKQKLGLTLEPVVSRLGIDVKMEKPAIFSREEGPKVSAPVESRSVEPIKVTSGHPSIMKKRGYEQSNGLDGPAAKRPILSVIRQAGSSLRQPTARGGLVNHSSVNGRGNRMPGGGRFKTHIMSWIDAPDDVYFLATDNTRKLRKEMTSHEMKRTARNPWRILAVRAPSRSKASDVVVLD